MNDKPSLKRYTHEEWMIQFEYPEDWNVMPCPEELDQALMVSSNTNEAGCRPSVIFQTSCAANAEVVLRQIIANLQQTCQEFEIIKEPSEPERSHRASVIYAYQGPNRSLISEKVVLTLTKERLLIITATASDVAWRQYAKVFHHLIGSVKSLEKNETIGHLPTPSTA